MSSFKPSNHPGALINVVRGHRMDIAQRAALFIFLRGGDVSNIELAAHLGVPSKGLRSTLVRSGLFAVDVCDHGGGKCQPWYRLRADLIAGPRTDKPAVRATIEPVQSLAAIGYDRGSVSTETKGN